LSETGGDPPHPEQLRAELQEPSIVSLGPERFQVQLPDMNYKQLLASHRRAEVAMVIQRTPGWVLLQTKLHYPPGLFRVPTGVIRKEETPDETMLRELREEANLTPGRHRRLFRLHYAVEGQRKDFFTEAFLIEAPQGELMPLDRTEAIIGWREAQVSELVEVARELRRLEPPRDGWGLFRSAVHQLRGRVLAPAGG
jgi:ADP-ribose pyrophosphatase YjhB (NUDIX family)